MRVKWRVAWACAATLYEGDDCLLWPFALRGGYPAMTGGYGHVFVCAEAHGPRPPGMEAEHICGVRQCMNKRHLRWATHKVNCQRRTEHGTQTIGERHGRSKLKRREVEAIRRAPKVYGSGLKLARQCRVAKTTISMVRGKRIWK